MLNQYMHRYELSPPKHAVEIFEMMRMASELMRELDLYFASHDLSFLRFLILIVLDREFEEESRVEAIPFREVFESFDLTMAVFSRTVKSMHDAGLLVISVDPHDKRQRLLKISSTGLEVVHLRLPGYLEILERFDENVFSHP